MSFPNPLMLRDFFREYFGMANVGSSKHRLTYFCKCLLFARIGWAIVIYIYILYIYIIYIYYIYIIYIYIYYIYIY